jgi:hypothetical protein
MARDLDDDNLVYPPEPEPPMEPAWQKFRDEYEAAEQKRKQEEAKRLAEFERSTRNFKVKPTSSQV